MRISHLPLPEARRSPIRHIVLDGGPTALIFGFTSFVAWTDASPSLMAFVAPFAIATALTAVLVALSRRVRASLVTTFVLFGAFFSLSKLQSSLLGRPILFYDLRYLSAETLLHVMRNYVGITALAIFSGALVLTAVIAAFRFEPVVKLTRPAFAGLAAVALASATLLAFHARALAARDVFFVGHDGHAVDSFIASATHGRLAIEPLAPKRAIEAEHASDPPARPPAGGWPHIVAILEESTFRPDHIASDAYTTPAIREFFEPQCGKSGLLRVHVTGGGTWLSEFAFIVGVPSSAFGTNASYLPYLLEGKVSDGLPNQLKKLGYRTVAIYPTDGNFVNGRAFDKSLGFDEFYDPSDFGGDASRTWEKPDATILDRVASVLARDVTRPTFVFAMTLNQHGPHGARGARVPPTLLAQATQGREVADYLYRLRESVDAMAALEARLAQSSTNADVVLVHFGDHQPTFTADLSPEAVPTIDGVDPRYVTYYSMKTLSNSGVCRKGAAENLDLALLYTKLFAYAKLPISGTTKLRAELAQSCGGLYAGCTSPAVGELHRALVDTGALRLF